MKIVVKQDEILSLEQQLLNYISNINSNLNDVDKLRDLFVWQGRAYKAFDSKYYSFILNEKRQILKLELLVKILDEVLYNYGNAQEMIQDTFKKAIELNNPSSLILVSRKRKSEASLVNLNVNDEEGILKNYEDKLLRVDFNNLVDVSEKLRVLHNSIMDNLNSIETIYQNIHESFNSKAGLEYQRLVTQYIKETKSKLDENNNTLINNLLDTKKMYEDLYLNTKSSFNDNNTESA